MKICSICKINKDDSEFHKKSASKDGLQSNCKSCRKIIDAASYLKYPKRRSDIKERRNNKQKYNKQLYTRYKRMCGCLICGEKEPVALDLHHLDSKGKDKNPANLMSYSTLRLKKEIRKCVVLCSNCHRKVHAGLILLQ